MDEFVRAIEDAIGDGTGARELACAKINLALHVTGRRTDGYHSIESLVVFADYGDVLAAAPSDDGRLRLTVKGEFAARLGAGTPPDDNLAVRAANELAHVAGKKRVPPTKILLIKRIPVASGLGGGSADAAATLRLLNREWNTNLSEAKLAAIGGRLGADVPMCLVSRPLLAEGIGDRITPITGVPALPIVMAHPGIAVPTAAVFANLSVADRSSLPPLPEKFGSLLDVIFWLRQARNDLAEPAARVNKAAASAAKALMRDPDCLFSRMSGSGAAAFGIFVTLEAAERAAVRLREAKPTWWVIPAMTLPS
ncbi:MAG TPA: 4-(cytidine 5'-diphospho)-2-C-methyl-D-erythritol kinase [Bauldia sp.]